MKPLTVWHFAGSTLRDGKPLPNAGTRLPRVEKPVPCERGYHGSVRLLDALRYAPGTLLAQCDLRGTIIANGNPVVDKHVASVRVYLTDYVDVRAVLVAWSRRVALHAIRVTAADALDAAGVTEHARKLRALPDDVDLLAAWAAAVTAGDAAGAAWSAARASGAAWVAWSAAGAARAAAGAAGAARAALDLYNSWLEADCRKALGIEP